MTDLTPEEIAHLKAQIVELSAAQKYSYIGKDGKQVLARVLEDERDALRDTLTQSRAETAMAYERIAVLVGALTTLQDLMCEGFEDVDGNSGCGRCENDCTGAALAPLEGSKK